MGFTEGMLCGFLLFCLIYEIFSRIYEFKNIDNPYVWVRKSEVEQPQREEKE